MIYRAPTCSLNGSMAARIASWNFREGEEEFRAHEDMLQRKYRSWRGRSGRAYTFSVYSPLDCPAYEDAVLVVARRNSDRRTGAMACLDLGKAPDAALAELRERFLDRLDEVDFQIHVLADRGVDRRSLIEDIICAPPDA